MTDDIGIEAQGDPSMTQDNDSLKKGIGYVLNLLAKREYATSDIRAKLNSRYSPDLCEQIISYCQEQGYLSDERYASMFVRHRISGHYGWLKISFELRSKGIDDELIEQTLQDLEGGMAIFDHLAAEFLRQHYQIADLLDFKTKNRALRQLSGRGFTYEQISRAIDEYCAAQS